MDSAALHREQRGLAGALAMANGRYKVFLISAGGYTRIYWRFVRKNLGKLLKTTQIISENRLLTTENPQKCLQVQGYQLE